MLKPILSGLASFALLLAIAVPGQAASPAAPCYQQCKWTYNPACMINCRICAQCFPGPNPTGYNVCDLTNPTCTTTCWQDCALSSPGCFCR